MPVMTLNTEALAHNARKTAEYADRWGVSLLPVLKAVGSHPAALAVLREEGFARFGFAEADEPRFFGRMDGERPERVLIQLTPPSQAAKTAELFGRSCQTEPEVLQALDSAVKAAGLPGHEVLLMVDLGDGREGLPESEVAAVLDFAKGLTHVGVVGFGTTMCCLSDNRPPGDFSERLLALWDMFAEKGITEPTVSIGGSYFCGWLDENPVRPVTELRLGDPFILGEDIYREKALPGGPFRQDVCGLRVEVVELKTRWIADDDENGFGHASGQLVPPVRRRGLRRRALVNMGRFHVGLDSPVNLRKGNPRHISLPCDLPGAEIAGLTAGYLVLDVTDCPGPVKIGQKVTFWPGYWGLSQAFRNPAVKILADEARRPSSVVDEPAAGENPARG
ncbi:MAG: alanine racemase [Deltaproteobacteria bacterium]|jgi:predicted amino acid racemase|nr:alanine racemase [Deltaproteobacteria bacterium]